jgi:hypothetical protein
MIGNRERVERLTYFFEHFVALVEDEYLQVAEVKVALLDESEDAAWGADDHMGLLNALKESDVLADGNTTIDHLGAQLGKLLLESVELLLYLVSELSIVAKHEGRARLRVLR